MSDKTFWETLKGDGQTVLNKLRAIVHEGNVRRIVVRSDGRTVAEFPLTAGVVGVVLAPALAAIGALVAMLKDCSIEIERVQPDEADRPKASGE